MNGVETGIELEFPNHDVLNVDKAGASSAGFDICEGLPEFATNLNQSRVPKQKTAPSLALRDRESIVRVF